MEDHLDAKKLEFGAHFKEAKALTNAEVASILETQYNEMQADDKEPNPLLVAALNHAKRMATMKSQVVEECRRILETKPTNGRRLHSFEIAQLINLAPYEDTENATILIPSLGEFDPAFLEDVVNEVNKIAEYAPNYCIDSYLKKFLLLEMAAAGGSSAKWHIK